MVMITRRKLMVSAGLVGGGVLLGYAMAPFSTIDRARKLAGGDDALLVTWVKITPDNRVTVIVPHSEMGQGVHTAMPMMLAEELDADWALVSMEQAPADMAFANGALAKGYLGAADPSVPKFLSGLTDFSSRKIAEFMNLQLTGGSTSVRFTGVVGMRHAGAAARWMLIQAAAKEWNVAADEITTKESKLFHLGNGHSASYGDMASKAVEFDPPANLPLKDPKLYTIVGAPIQRFDIPAKVNGSAIYGVDVRMPGMMFAAIKACPVFGGKLKSFDAKAVKNMRGIKSVHSVGENAVAVVADNTWRAHQAIAALPVTWDEGPNAAHSSASIFAGMQAALEKGEFESDYDFGDADAATKSAARVIEASYAVPYLAHATMEPMNCTAHFSGGRLEVWGGFQDGLGARVFAAKVAGLPVEDVTLNHAAMGGGFGRRGSTLNYLEQAVLLAKQVDHPVNLIWSREEDLTQDNYRNASVANMRAGLDEAGRPVSWQQDYTEKRDPEDATWIPYAISDRRVRVVSGTDPIPFGPWRSVAHSQHGFFIESFVDELAHAAGRDPFEFRRDLMAEAPEQKAVLEAAASMSGWGTPLPLGRARGIALRQSFGTIVAQVAEVSVSPEGQARVHKVWCAVDPGEVVNPDTFAAQMESGIIYGLTAALYGEISIAKGRVVEQNFPDYEMIRQADAPAIEVKLMPSGRPTGGAGEPGTPPIAAAVANAVFSLTKQRIRSLPLRKHDLRGGIEQAKAG
ncbi:MAG: xanthine dehydrogenase family protein molybdopterin-binding subunit [Alphaproteobacteria bacterium]|nr:xanthine dehydrogenase family protein molybdopterin-binding subunit [Alphaproteobacteria bacterium]